MYNIICSLRCVARGYVRRSLQIKRDDVTLFLYSYYILNFYYITRNGMNQKILEGKCFYVCTIPNEFILHFPV